MEINGLVSQLPLYHVAQNDEVKKDVLKGIKPVIDGHNSKSKLGNDLSIFLLKDDIYEPGFQSVTKQIMDLNIPLSDSCGGGGG